MRVLVTGITGQVGSAIVSRLCGSCEIIAADRQMLDLSRPQEIAGRLSELNPEVIVNPAAYTAVDRAEDERDLAFLINAAAPDAIARWASQRDVPVVHFSTDYVFNGGGSRPWREDDFAAPLNVYGASKLAGENAVIASGAPHLIIRTSWVYAAQGNSFFRTIARLACDRDELRVVGDQIGSPTSAAYLGDALKRLFVTGAITRMDRARRRSILHLCAGGETSWYGFASAIVAGLEQRGVAVKVRQLVPIASQDYPTKAHRPLNSRLDLSQARSLFELEPVDWQALLCRELDKLVTQSVQF